MDYYPKISFSYPNIVPATSDFLKDNNLWSALYYKSLVFTLFGTNMDYIYLKGMLIQTEPTKPIMKIKSFLSVFVGLFMILFMLNTANAQKAQNSVGLGVMVGEPTGLSLKAWTSGSTAFDAGLAWSFGRYDAINIHADYLWHHFGVFGNEIEKGELPLYYGIGGRLVLADDYPNPGDNNAVLGVRGPVGIEYLFEESPVGVFFEVAPILNLAPSTDFDVDGAIGIRFYL